MYTQHCYVHSGIVLDVVRQFMDGSEHTVSVRSLRSSIRAVESASTSPKPPFSATLSDWRPMRSHQATARRIASARYLPSLVDIFRVWTISSGIERYLLKTNDIFWNQLFRREIRDFIVNRIHSIDIGISRELSPTAYGGEPARAAVVAGGGLHRWRGTRLPPRTGAQGVTIPTKLSVGPRYPPP